MADLSISKAWDETKEIVARDGKLIGAVALALIALPAAISGLVAPSGLMASTDLPAWAAIVVILASIVAIAGQLALIRLAIGPSTTVGEAIAHGIRRMPFYLLAAILIACALIVLGLPFVAILSIAGVPLDASGFRQSPVAALIGLLYFALVCFVGVRMLMTSSTASAEPIGPIAIIRRSWDLTEGNWWKLFGFLLIFFIGAVVVLAAVGAAVGVVAGILLGKPEPMTASALIVALVQALVNAAVTGLFAVMLARIYLQLSGKRGRSASVPSSGT